MVVSEDMQYLWGEDIHSYIRGRHWELDARGTLWLWKLSHPRINGSSYWLDHDVVPFYPSYLWINVIVQWE